MAKHSWVVLILAIILCIASCSRSATGPSAENLAIPEKSSAVAVAEEVVSPSVPDQPLDDFLNDASLAVVLRFPETITHLGLADLIGVRDDTLMPVSRIYELETISLLESLLAELDRYDLATVDPADALSARIYGGYLQDLLEGTRLSDHGYSISAHLSNYPDTIERLLGRSHPMQSLANVEDYISRLRQIPTRFDELIIRLEDSEAIGAVPPAFILRKASDSMVQIANTSPEEVSYFTAFVNRMDSIGSLSASRKGELAVEVEGIVRDSVLPAYRRLADFISNLADRIDDSIGVWRHVGGDEYYAYRLRKSTTTDLSADEIHDLGLAEVERIRQQIFEAAAGINLEAAADLPTLFAQLAETSDRVSGSEMIEVCGRLITAIPDVVRPAFAAWPELKIVVLEGGTSAYFSPGTLDGSRPGRFVAPAGREESTFALPTLTYHEAIPGHGLQIAFAHAAQIPTYRAGLGFTAYSEGWALYSERLVWELGAYEEDPLGNLGRLQAELFRAVRLVVDTGIHAKQWTYEEAVSYMHENTGLNEDYVRQEIERYIVAPGQATAYKIGMMKILELRDRAQIELGDAFDLATFHQSILEEGAVPLVILEELVDAYIADRR